MIVGVRVAKMFYEVEIDLEYRDNQLSSLIKIFFKNICFYSNCNF